MLYSNISRFYDLWSLGNKYYHVVSEFYLQESKKYRGPIVELGIGTGRIAETILNDHKVQIIGVDSCREMLKEAEKRLVNFSEWVTLIEKNFTSLHLPQKSDYIYMPFRTIGHLSNDEMRLKTLKSVYNNLNYGGTFIFDHYIMDKEWADDVEGEQLKMYQDSDLYITDQYFFNLEYQKMHCIVRCNDEIYEDFEFFWFHPEQIKPLILEAGFHIRDVYGNFDGSKLLSKSTNQIWILEK